MGRFDPIISHSSSDAVPAVTSMKNLKPPRFITHLEGLKDEFELLAEEIDALRKERDEYRAKVEAQAKELQDIRRNFDCERCRKGTADDPQMIAAATSLSSNPLGKLDSSGTFRGVVPSQHSTQCMTLIQEPQAHFIPTQPSPIDSQLLSLPSSQPPALTIDPGSDSEEHDWSIIFNSEGTRELDIEMVHTLVHEQMVHCVKFSQDGKFIAFGCGDGRAYIYDVQTGILTCVLKNLLAEDDFFDSVCFNHNRKYLATSAQDARIYIWDINTKHVRNAFKGHTDLINTLDFSPNGRLLVSTSVDNTVRLWDMRHGAAKVWTNGSPRFYGHHYYTSAVFSPDGRHVASSHADGMLRIWDVRTGQQVRNVKAHNDRAHDVVFTPDGKGLVSGGSDKNLEYWDISSSSTTQRRASSHGHTASVYSLSVSPDGRWVASASVDRSVRIWDTRNAAMQCILTDNEWVYSVDFSPAGPFLVSGGRGGTVRIWRYSSTSRLGRTVYSGQTN